MRLLPDTDQTIPAEELLEIRDLLIKLLTRVDLALNTHVEWQVTALGGNKVRAIKQVRDATGCSLLAAKRMVEEFMDKSNVK